MKPTPIRLVIAVDDLQRWESVRPHFIEELTAFVADHTQLHSLYWLVTLDLSSYDSVTGQTRFWEEYTTPPRQLIRSREDLSALPIIGIGGWLVLDELNLVHRLGVELIRAVLAQGDSSATALALDAIEEDEAVLRNLSNPQIAWILLDLRAELPIQLKTLVNVTFVEFIQRYWSRRRTNLDPSPLSPTELQQAVGLIAKVLADCGEFVLPVTRLLDRITRAAKGRSELQDRSRARDALRVLQRAQLLQIEPVSRPAPELPEEMAEVRFETFWQWQLAQQLLKSSGIEAEEVDRAIVELETWFGAADAHSLKEGVLEFILLLLDKEVTRGEARPKFVSRLWRQALSSTSLPLAALWLAGPKASIAAQRSLVYWISKQQPSSLSGRLLFSFMCFVGGALSEAMDAPQRLKFLRPHFEQIRAARLSHFYLYLAEQLLMRAPDADTIAECLPWLSGCEVLEIAPHLAEAAVGALQRRTHGDPPPMFAIFARYLQSLPPLDAAAAPLRAQGRRWRRYFFHEWALFEFSRWLVEEHGVDAYQLFVQQNWYRADRLGIRGRTTLDMARAANLALGYWYRRRAPREGQKEYVELVKRLLRSEDVRERQISFYLIRHTESTTEEPAAAVDRVFRPLLESLRRDPTMERLVSRYRHFFEVSLRGD